MPESPCPLCRREARTKHHFEDDVLWVVDCLTCGVPMVVLKRHVATPTDWERAYAKRIGEALFPEARFDDTPRSIPEHWHAHLR